MNLATELERKRLLPAYKVDGDPAARDRLVTELMPLFARSRFATPAAGSRWTISSRWGRSG